MQMAKETYTHLNSNSRIELNQLRKLLRCQATAKDPFRMTLQLIQNLLLLSWQQWPFHSLLEQSLQNTSLVCFFAAAEAVIPD